MVERDENLDFGLEMGKCVCMEDGRFVVGGEFHAVLCYLWYLIGGNDMGSSSSLGSNDPEFYDTIENYYAPYFWGLSDTKRFKKEDVSLFHPSRMFNFRLALRDWYRSVPGLVESIPQRLESRFGESLCRMFHLPLFYNALFTLWYWSVNGNGFCYALRCFGNCIVDHFEQLVGIRLGELDLFGKNSLLASCGIIIPGNSDYPSLTYGWPTVSGWFRHLLRTTTLDGDVSDSCFSLLLKEEGDSALSEEDFSHVKEYSVLKQLLRSSFEDRSVPCNILIYGKPGTGKTEMAKVICSDLGFSLYSSSSSDEEQTPAQRRSSLVSAQCFLEKRDDSVLLMDEAEDVFGVNGFESDSKSKLFFHRILDKNPVPTIWICNSVWRVDPAHLRRFSYVLEMPSLSRKHRERVWLRVSKRHNVPFDSEEIRERVRKYPVVPSLIDRAVQNAAITGDTVMIDKTLESFRGVLSMPKEDNLLSLDDDTFSVGLFNTDMDLFPMIVSVIAQDIRRFSMLLYGVSGSGKSLFARYLADRIGLPVLFKRASDLLSPYVGQTERNIADAFNEAKDDEALLIFDEADSLLRDRNYASRSWEVTQVNEMLTQMEHHPLPFVCTTNLMSDIDSASFRRFTFKVRYDYLTQKQVQTAFRLFFNQELPDGVQFKYLTPGDFANVARQVSIFGAPNVDVIVSRLKAEQSIKGTVANQIGFSTGGDNIERSI